MSTQITTAFVQQYKNNVELLSQQKGSRLRNAVRIERVGAEFAYFEQIGAVSAAVSTTRHEDTPLSNTPHARRRVGLANYKWADLVDTLDKVRMLIDPTSTYAVNAAHAFGRTMDDVIIEALFGSAATGKNGETAVTFPAGQDVDVVGTTVGLTIDKLIETKKKFWANEVDLDSDPLYFLCGSKQLENLLKTTQVTSADYNIVKALVKGDVDTFMGFNFLRSERLPVTSTVRSCAAWTKSGMLLALGKEMTAKIAERPDKSHATQVYCEMAIGATRMEEVKVARVFCKE